MKNDTDLDSNRYKLLVNEDIYKALLKYDKNAKNYCIVINKSVKGKEDTTMK